MIWRKVCICSILMKLKKKKVRSKAECSDVESAYRRWNVPFYQWSASSQIARAHSLAGTEPTSVFTVVEAGPVPSSTAQAAPL